MILKLDRLSMSLIRNFLSLTTRCRFHRQNGNHKTICGDDCDEETGHCEVKEIPKELQEMIFSGVNVSDWFRLKAVCKSWKDILDDNSFITIPQTLPWMLLPPREPYNSDSTLSFFDMVEGKTHKFKNFPKELKGSWYCMSSKGWMLFGKGSLRKPSFYLLNPLSMLFFELPSVLTIPKAKLDLPLDLPYSLLSEPNVIWSVFVSKLRLSSTDAFNSIVAVIFGYRKEVLVVCKPGVDHSWIVIDHKPETPPEIFQDIMFSKDGKTLNVLVKSRCVEEEEGDIVTVEQHTVGSESITVKRISNCSILQTATPSISQVEGFIYATHKYFRQHLVESIHGELLIVTVWMNCFWRFLDWDDHQDDLMYRQAGEIRVHVVHENKRGEDVESEWINVVGMTTTEIESLGDQVLFVAEAGSFSYNAPANVERIQNNQIFFMANRSVSRDADRGLTVSQEYGVYSFDQRKIRWRFPIRYPHHYKPCWFTPTL